MKEIPWWYTDGTEWQRPMISKYLLITETNNPK